VDQDGRQGRSGNDARRPPAVAAPAPADLEGQARELERRAVDADEAVARAETARSDPAGGADGSRRTSSELRRLRGEADLLMERALAARLEADRAAETAGGDGPADGVAPVPVTSWGQGALGWEEMLSVALDEAPAAPLTGETETNGTNGTNGAQGHHRPPPPEGR